MLSSIMPKILYERGLHQKNPNDGKQTPQKGHPVFVAQHATATCCRSCLYKWHHIEKDKKLTQLKQDHMVNLILAWIRKEL